MTPGACGVGRRPREQWFSTGLEVGTVSSEGPNRKDRPVMQRATGLAIALAVLASGCAMPRVVKSISPKKDRVNFLYVHGTSQGIVQCKAAADGELSECSEKPVVFEEK